MHGGHWGGERIPRTCWPPTDDEPLREFGAPPFVNFLRISHSIKGRHHGEHPRARNDYDEETAFESYMNPEPGFQSGPGDSANAD